jgi:hypothetical protein
VAKFPLRAGSQLAMSAAMGHPTLALIQTITPTEQLLGTRESPLIATAKIALGTLRPFVELMIQLVARDFNGSARAVAAHPCRRGHRIAPPRMIASPTARYVKAEKTKPPSEATSILRSQYFPDAVASGWGRLFSYSRAH